MMVTRLVGMLLVNVLNNRETFKLVFNTLRFDYFRFNVNISGEGLYDI